ncbi:MAG TPA: DUF433 domain-containing protein [Casimicrobium huifangae]|jgi:uncharacterized protein (DUF433 family)|uniref:DUF433 domain-containing protein n=1 Tax=Casimicrobium huifangae TaxID=2591109 RepID=UPI0012EC2024|nr:DUF433 domain-containing protein [Casimicrobium huifangae]HOB00080.1 DUF433 domain-containing protein [Casimicrobium huifangae]HQA32399.1 DUF433 domain-containing protein [Casimicrobium huifangae]HQD63980.1 DUF433 domain-containing protein [Casimicrobium huifangae]
MNRKAALGIYALHEAERLTGVKARSLRRWLFGYSYASRLGRDGKNFSAPLWRSQYSSETFSEPVVGFHDLLEARVVGEFVKAGVPLIVIRSCLQSARDLFGIDYPFTAHRFLTDGRTIYRDALKSAEDGALLNLKSRQFAFGSVIRPSLYAGIEYSGTAARRWFPDARVKSIALDPTIAFGKPHVVDVGVPTGAVYSTYLAEDKDAVRTAKILEIDRRQVESAVRFEERLAA